ncbi:tRNA (uridine(34)/cytosine(34)/5-carboxymethylaminomethyluridine(34)-2'-O)-methyltransferase TrmL [Bacillaceae bacterium SIJ1]|uniref:tRNA (uridine(34)/cytosine(34)/5- carboxymethylaminomethyluridine(34)-2'-O)- methyltransferase TrmL n=1 Tax=Litoribacterium kuwaitense TaxID=1398745 RepID=UPI0013EA2735|nr:tRNA (uridine(34)/cytosine(34)/5-carboxymethylaminomethyluridine(34)-2'-O)-methyltransferase TrmL [Litoribacterium kuwaitense]NGP43869.1 tRNA (uridine(34)/cytosine(34)/5-carboxymethylaminomethyluridine(34)-2'-O)-methyltransferase TrmL [Litoribacterium kuwaitense]
MANHIVLYQPEIPSNTGNIARTCAATQTPLHLVRPLGFSTEDRMLKRAGVDYWDFVDIHYHDSLDEVFSTLAGADFYLLTKHGKQFYSDFSFDQPRDQVFIFGKESTGLPPEVIKAHEDKCLRMPMTGEVRALNLSNVACVMIYEAMRQQGFPDME